MYVFTKARKTALKKARKKWKGMSGISRRKAMPSRVKTPKKIHPVGTYMMLDIGRKGKHYQFVQKTKYGWKRVKAPQRLLKAGWKRENKGYVREPAR